MATSVIQARIETELKENVEEALSSMGLTMSAAINIYFRQIVNQGKIPFDIAVAPKTNQKNVEQCESRRDSCGECKQQ